MASDSAEMAKNVAIPSSKATEDPPRAVESAGTSRPSLGSDDIYEAAVVCRRGFEEYLQHPRLYRKQVAEFQRRFLTWACFLGVFAPVSACLDTRLADRPEIKELVTSMLAVLRRSLEHGIRRHPMAAEEESITESPPENDGAMVGITGSIDRLSRLTPIIRRPSKPDDVEKVLKSSRKRKPDGFEDVIFALVKWRFPVEKMPASLQVQLASSIVYRRNRLRYQAELAGPGQFDTGQATPPPPLANEASSTRSNNPFIAAEYPEAPAVPVGHSDAKCTICRNPQPKRILMDKKHWRTHLDQDLRPYVCISEQCGNLPPSFSSRKDWRNHMRNVHRDDWAQYIHPSYHWLCIWHDTPLPFADEELLLQHLRSEHSDAFPDREQRIIASRSKVPVRSEARLCPFCGEDVTATVSDTGSAEAGTNKEGVVAKQDVFMPAATAHIVNRTVEGNPPPAEAETLKSSSGASQHTGAAVPSLKKDALAIKMQKHIADHLESLALWSLRWWDDDTGEAVEDGKLSSQGPEPAVSKRSQSRDSGPGNGLAIESYTIAWVCALDEEYQASCRMLNEEYVLPPDSLDLPPQNDRNAYTFGKVGEHYVVVGCTPSGRTGSINAAIVASDMIHAFPGLKCALMVGIGGGAPLRRRDIRLGDVVVSTPSGDHGGVVQLDFGAQLQSGLLRRRGHLNAVSDILLAATENVRLRLDDPDEPDRIAQHMARMDCVPSYQRPTLDQLYLSKYEHRDQDDADDEDDDNWDDDDDETDGTVWFGTRGLI